MESHDVDVRKRAIQQLVVELLAPYHSRLQPVELTWPSSKTASHEQPLWLTLPHEPEPRLIIPLTRHQLDSAVSPHDTQAYADLRAYIWRKVQPLIH